MGSNRYDDSFDKEAFKEDMGALDKE